MNEVQKEFEQDAHQKKVTARSAKKRVGNRKGCTLPSDYLTPAQKKRLSGEVKILNLNQPITWDQFKALDKSLQEMYINHIITEFKVGLCTIGFMFGLQNKSLNSYIARNGLKVKKMKGPCKKADRERFLDLYVRKTEIPAQEPEQVEREEIPAMLETRAASVTNILTETRLASCDFMFKGVEDWNEILNLLCKIPLPKKAKVYIRVQEGENESQD